MKAALLALPPKVPRRQSQLGHYRTYACDRRPTRACSHRPGGTPP